MRVGLRGMGGDCVEQNWLEGKRGRGEFICKTEGKAYGEMKIIVLTKKDGELCRLFSRLKNNLR